MRGSKEQESHTAMLMDAYQRCVLAGASLWIKLFEVHTEPNGVELSLNTIANFLKCRHAHISYQPVSDQLDIISRLLLVVLEDPLVVFTSLCFLLRSHLGQSKDLSDLFSSLSS